MFLTMDTEIFNVVFDNALIFDDADILNIYMKMPIYSKYI